MHARVWLKQHGPRSIFAFPQPPGKGAFVTDPQPLRPGLHQNRSAARALSGEIWTINLGSFAKGATPSCQDPWSGYVRLVHIRYMALHACNGYIKEACCNSNRAGACKVMRWGGGVGLCIQGP